MSCPADGFIAIKTPSPFPGTNGNKRSNEVNNIVMLHIQSIGKYVKSIDTEDGVVPGAM